MEIKIDTKKDSKEDLQKIIEFLQKFIHEGSASPEYDSTVSEGAFNMFGDNSETPSEPDKLDEPETEDKNDKIEIVEY